MSEGLEFGCIDGVEISEFAEGNLATERIEELLDHVEVCRECAAALQTVVILKAHRREAIELLRRARDWKEGQTWTVTTSGEGTEGNHYPHYIHLECDVRDWPFPVVASRTVGCEAQRNAALRIFREMAQILNAHWKEGQPCSDR